MVQTLNLILLTATELHQLRALLKTCFQSHATTEDREVFASLFDSWCHNPVATFSLCLLAQAYDVSFALMKEFSNLDITVGFLMQIDKLVQLLESPIFVHLRLQLLDVEAPHHASLLKGCYGLLMLLPQSDAFRSLNDRLSTVCNLRDNLGVSAKLEDEEEEEEYLKGREALVGTVLDSDKLLRRFREVMALHKRARERSQQQMAAMEGNITNNGGIGVGGMAANFSGQYPQRGGVGMGGTGGGGGMPSSKGGALAIGVGQGGNMILRSSTSPGGGGAMMGVGVGGGSTTMNTSGILSNPGGINMLSSSSNINVDAAAASLPLQPPGINRVVAVDNSGRSIGFRKDGSTILKTSNM
eukprot:CAMPEP_0171311070 /NCGR_PEP_ID=MMETSP0816-20121228/21304_1 /TAXON_ID=420281 /ORGANISM="Proboscia inermis, Strain CCAP1064/1" /LENGTH=355 /DNA_ID=CAMNT_0011795605 /DNA_START=292 /DNA_END=1359 /DNA_ORIENTATION=+